MMKQIILLTVIMVAMLAGACHETTIGLPDGKKRLV